MLDNHAAEAGKLRGTSLHKNNKVPVHGKKHKAKVIPVSPPQNKHLGGVSIKSGDILPNSKCNNLCNVSAGSQCVAISGGLSNTPQCTCTTAADCAQIDSGWLAVGWLKCAQYYPTAPKSYKEPICCYESPRITSVWKQQACRAYPKPI